MNIYFKLFNTQQSEHLSQSTQYSMAENVFQNIQYSATVMCISKYSLLNYLNIHFKVLRTQQHEHLSQCTLVFNSMNIYLKVKFISEYSIPNSLNTNFNSQ